MIAAMFQYHQDLDNRLSNIESGENLVKCNEPEPVDMQEVNELMNEMSEFYDESEETSDLIEERLAKTINTLPTTFANHLRSYANSWRVQKILS
jgi:uncharacterized protein YllA (UPF0747 family)